MDISTEYATMRLVSPLIAGASPLTLDLAAVREVAAAGIGAVVMHSLFEEDVGTERHPDAQTCEACGTHEGAPTSTPQLGVADYLERLQQLKASIAIPVIASVNCTGPGPWLEALPRIVDAGADALELSIYSPAADPQVDGASVVSRLIQAVSLARDLLTVPLAVKLTPYYSSLANLAHRLERAGCDALVLFSRFYQPDFDVERRVLTDHMRLSHFSDDMELRKRLRWTAILSPQIPMDIAVSGGVHSGSDVVKALCAGAAAVQVTSAFLSSGPSHAAAMLENMKEWIRRAHGDSVKSIRGVLQVKDPAQAAALERRHYVHVLRSWPSHWHGHGSP